MDQKSTGHCVNCSYISNVKVMLNPDLLKLYENGDDNFPRCCNIKSRMYGSIRYVYDRCELYEFKEYIPKF